MLDKTERKNIGRLLLKHFDLGQLRLLVTFSGQDWDSVVGQGANKTDATCDILDASQRDGWVQDLLEALADDARARLQPPYQQNAIDIVESVQESLTERLGRGTALEDPFSTCFVVSDLPYVNRPTVREAFSNLAKPIGSRIAVIDGPSESGKSYCRYLPQFVSELQKPKSFWVYYKDVSEGSYDLTARQLVQSILRRRRVDRPIPARVSQDSSYASELSEWLANQVPSGQTWWIIVDGLAKITPDPGLRDFLMALANYLTASRLPELRLVLLDLGSKHTYPVSAAEGTEKAEIGLLTADELVEHYFSKIHCDKNLALSLDPDKVQSIAEAVVEHMQTEQDPIERKRFLLKKTRELGLL